MIGMKTAIFKALCLSLTLTATIQTVDAAAIPKNTKVATPLVSLEKQTPIEKALTQQKRERGDNRLIFQNDQIKILNSLKSAPSQNFLAEQHQRFSRFVQAFFPQHNS